MSNALKKTIRKWQQDIKKDWIVILFLIGPTFFLPLKVSSQPIMADYAILDSVYDRGDYFEVNIKTNYHDKRYFIQF